MPRIIIRRCLLVSAVVAFAASMLTTTQLLSPHQNASYVDFSSINPEVLAQTRELNDLVEQLVYVPVHEVSAMDRLKSVFVHPQYLQLMLKSWMSWFMALFSATLAISLMQLRELRRAKSGEVSQRMPAPRRNAVG